jgi:hypothetical protein
MTDARAAWVEAQDRKRMSLSFGIALGLYLVGFGIFALFGLFREDVVSDYAGPVIVRLGRADGADVTRPTEADAPPAPAAVAERPTPETLVPPVPEAAVKPPTEAPAIRPTPTTQQTATPRPVQPTAPAQPVPAVVPSPTPEPVPAQPASQTLRGSETGNSYDMTIEAISGTAGRSLYEPIWLYMPLPYELPNAIYAAIPDRKGLPGTAAQRREQFAKVYELVSGTWRLKKGPLPGSQPVYESRPPIWVMLEDAGYDVENAEYKTANKLREITLLFKVSPYHPERGVSLQEVLVERSSGISTIDDAVVYAFSKAQFSNSGDKSINGRLNYRF